MIAKINVGSAVAERIRIIYELSKFRLTITVVFSACFGYIIASQEPINIVRLVILSVAGYLVTTAANIVNQIKEKELDRLMKRTADRPLPTGRIEIKEAWLISLICLIIGLFVFTSIFNVKSASIALISFILYGFVYTPLKRIGAIAVFMGAFPGAFPPMIGWLAATNEFGWEPGILFAIQFFWQFPHFWAIAWVVDEDYQKAGFKLLPGNGKKCLNTAIQIMIYTIFLIPLGWVPMQLGMTGVVSAIIATVCGLLFLLQTFQLTRKLSNQSALMMMFASFMYLPIVQISFIIDKM